jgi:hypothetical protein
MLDSLAPVDLYSLGAMIKQFEIDNFSSLRKDPK